jgi:hypothetical protein
LNENFKLTKYTVYVIKCKCVFHSAKQFMKRSKRTACLIWREAVLILTWSGALLVWHEVVHCLFDMKRSNDCFTRSETLIIWHKMEHCLLVMKWSIACLAWSGPIIVWHWVKHCFLTWIRRLLVLKIKECFLFDIVGNTVFWHGGALLVWHRKRNDLVDIYVCWTQKKRIVCLTYREEHLLLTFRWTFLVWH